MLEPNACCDCKGGMLATSLCGLCTWLALKLLQLSPAFSLWAKPVLCQGTLINIIYCQATNFKLPNLVWGGESIYRDLGKHLL